MSERPIGAGHFGEVGVCTSVMLPRIECRYVTVFVHCFKITYTLYRDGWIMGSNLNHCYNLTFVVEQSAKIGKPIIAVSLNYCLSSYGFLF